MRLPKFRCKNKTGNWCFFTVLHNGNVNEENFNLETLSQFTGLFDKQGVEIYEGDIVLVNTEQIRNAKAKIIFKQGSFMCEWIKDDSYSIEMSLLLWQNRAAEEEMFEVVGNVYENLVDD